MIFGIFAHKIFRYMRDINEILSGDNIGSIITELKNRSYSVIDWGEVVKDYEPQFHKIVTDQVGRKDKYHKGGGVDKAARIPIGLEKLLTKRITEFTFAIPVKRSYSGLTADTEEKTKMPSRRFTPRRTSTRRTSSVARLTMRRARFSRCGTPSRRSTPTRSAATSS